MRGRKRSGGQARRRARRVRIGEADPRLTSCAGVEAVRELDRVLGVIAALEQHVGAVKQRRPGLSGAETLLAMVSVQLTGGDFLVSLDRRRADAAGQLLEPVPTPPSTTASGIARRFHAQHLRGIEAAMGEINTRMVGMVGQVRRPALLEVATIDGDTTDVEVYDRLKENAEYKPRRAAQPAPAPGVLGRGRGAAGGRVSSAV